MPARQDFLKAIKDLAEKSPAAAERLLERIEEAGASLAQFPDRGRAVPELGLPRRELIVEDFRLVYRRHDAEVEILRLIHGRQDFVRAWREAPKEEP